MIPKPQSFQPTASNFDFQRPLVIVVADASESFETMRTAEVLATELRDLDLDVVVGAAEEGKGNIELRVQESAPRQEGYRLIASTDRLRVESASPAGIFFGTRSILSFAALGRAPGGTTVDAPRYAWRGAHLDVARHFFPVSSIKRFIDLLALHKMNIFHWHLTEDQGWRIEIDAFPKLTEIAAWRSKSGEKYGGFYTKEEVREVVAYAQERFITVVPEIEMPGHAIAALAAYPELSCTGGPFTVETEWGIFDDVYCAGSDQTLDFLERVLDEVIELFPGQFFHIGGDECPKKRWESCPKCQARIKKEGLAGEAGLQSWVISHMSQFLSERNRRLVGWDEILEGGLAEGATVMSWRGTEGGVRAAQMNHDVVMTPTTHCYFDYRQSSEEDEPGAWFAPELDLETVYSYEPTPTELTPEQAAHVLGVQGNIWTEKMSTFKHVEYMMFPRLCALSEVGWSGPERDFEDFQERLRDHRVLLDRLNVGYRGSPHAQPELPSESDKARYLAAKQQRASDQAVAAY